LETSREETDDHQSVRHQDFHIFALFLRPQTSISTCVPQPF